MICDDRAITQRQSRCHDRVRLDRSDMLVPNDSTPIDHEAFGHAGGSQGDLNLALNIAPNALVRVAVTREEIGERYRASFGTRIR